jgi:outer membrane lipoprotein
MRPRLCLVLVVALAACARPPAVLQGPATEIGVLQAQRQDMSGTRVRWGGQIVATTPEQDITCFQILALPLDRRARPERVDVSEGRFIACAPGFYDPEVYAPKREVTVTGIIGGRIAGKVGEVDYQFPRIAADVVYLWPQRRQRAVVYGYPAYPYGGWWGYPYPYWYGGFAPLPYYRYPYRPYRRHRW